jgi:mannosyltransferase
VNEGGLGLSSDAVLLSGTSSGSSLFILCLGLLSLATGYAIWLLRRAGPAPDDRAVFPALTRQTVVALVGLGVLATVLRCLGLDSGLWYDEVLTLVRFVRLSATELVTTFTSPNNHVLYSLLAHGSTAVLGESAFALRLPAALLGVGSVWALWLLGEEITSRRESLLAALLMAVSYHHVWFSQNARGYTGLLLFGLIGTWVFIAGIRRRLRGFWVLYAAALGLAMFIHMSAAFLFFAHGLVYVALFVYTRVRASDEGLVARAVGPVPGASEAWPLLGFVLGGVLTLQFYAGALPAVIDTFAPMLSAPVVAASPVVHEASSWSSPLWTVLEIVRGLHIGLASAFGVVLAGGLAGAGFLSYARRDPLAASLFVLPFVVTLVILFAFSFRIWPRYFFVLIGFASLVLVRGAFVIGEAAVRIAASRWSSGAQGRVGVRVGTALALLPICASALSLAPNYRLPKQDYEGARDYVESLRTEGDRVVTIGLASYPFEAYYAPRWQRAEDLAELELVRDEVRGEGARTWVVYSFSGYLNEKYPGITEELEMHFEPMDEFDGTLGDGTIYVWRSRARVARPLANGHSRP